MDPVTVSVQLIPADLKRFNRYVVYGRRRNLRGLILVGIAVALFAAAHFWKSEDHSNYRTPDRIAREEPDSSGFSFDRLPTALLPFAIFAAIIGFYYWKARHPSSYEARYPGVFKPMTFEVLEGGFFCQTDHAETIHYWPGIFRFAETPEDFYVLIARRSGHILPKRCFPTQEDMALFRNQMQLHLEKHAPAALAAK